MALRKASVFRLALLAVLILAGAWTAWLTVTSRSVNALLKDLASDDPAVADAAADKLSRYHSSAAVRRIIAEYGNIATSEDIAAKTRSIASVPGGDSYSRAKFAVYSDEGKALTGILARIGPPAIGPLSSAMKRQTPWWRTLTGREPLPDETIRAVAMARGSAAALGRIGAPAVPSLMSVLEDKRGDTNMLAGEALAAIGAPAVPALVVAVNNKAFPQRENAALALGCTADPSAIAPLVSRLMDKTESVPFRARVAFALGKIDDSRVVDALTVALTDDSRDVRMNAATTMRDQSDPRAVDLLIKALGDPDQRVRFMAASALGDFGDARATAALVRAVTGPDLMVREFATRTFRKKKDPQVVDMLLSVLCGGTDDDKHYAAIALEILGGDKGRAAVGTFIAGTDLAKIAADRDAYIRAGDPGTEWLLILALERCGDINMARTLSWSANSALAYAAGVWAGRHDADRDLQALKKPVQAPQWGESLKDP